MAGIVSAGGYVPILRMDRKVIASAWNRGSVGGERSIANNDEDSITMAVEACLNCLNGRSRKGIDGLYFCSTTSPYAEKMNAAVVAAAADLKNDLLTTDYTNSLRSSLSGLRSALDSVKSGSATSLLVTAADTRLAYPKSDQEQMFGDGAAAVMIGNVDTIASYQGGYCITNDVMDVWRNSGEQYVRQWEGRFVLTQGFSKQMSMVITGLLKKFNLSPGEIAKVVFPAPDPRTHIKIANSLGFSEQQIQEPFLTQIGHCGTAHPLLMLASALETVEEGDLILVAAYGDGADALLFKANQTINKTTAKISIPSLLNSKMLFDSYSRFLSYKGVVEAQPGEPFRLLPSATATWREEPSAIRCHASKCNHCGVTTFPIQRVCVNCRTKDDFTEVRLSEKNGTIFTFTRDNLAGRPDDPVIIQTVAELEGQVRFYGLMTDVDPDQVELEKTVEMTFRKIYEGAGFNNYFWKLRPLRKGGNE